MQSQFIPDKDLFRIGHMIEYSSLVLHLGSGKTEEELKDDIALSMALVKLIEIIGEAAAHVSKDIQQRSPHIPWSSIIGTRNRLIHGYFEVDFSIIVSTIENKIPILLDQLLELQAELLSEKK